MVRPPHRLLAVLAATTLVVTVALCWAGWRLLDQQRTIDQQRQREQLENRADAIAAGVRGRLAEAGERLAGWLSDPATPIQPLESAVLVGIDATSVLTVPRNALPYVPVTPRNPGTPDVFSKIEAIEFGASNTNEAADRYRGLTRERDAQVRAGALLRLGRVLRRSKDFSGALVAYRELASSGDVWVEGMPAELAALQGRRATLTAMGDRENAARVTSGLVEQLDRGRWPLTRGLAEFHRDEIGAAPRPDSWRLADALHDTIAEPHSRLPGRGHRVVKTDRGSVLVLWRSSGDRTALLSAFADRFFGAAAPEGLAWRLADAGGETIAGDLSAPLQSVGRLLGNAEYPWTVQTWRLGSQPPGQTGGSRTILLAMMAAMLVFVWGASYFIARAIRREAEVTRLQSDFVAAVSHEFRSPLTIPTGGNWHSSPANRRPKSGRWRTSCRLLPQRNDLAVLWDWSYVPVPEARRATYPVHGSNSIFTADSKSAMLRVTSVNSCASAVAAIRASIAPIRFPALSRRATIVPHASATRASTVNTRPSNRNGNSCRTQSARRCLRVLEGRRSTPYRSSPSVTTLMKTRSSSTSASHATTRGCGLGFTHSETTLVSSRKVTDRLGAGDPFAATLSVPIHATANLPGTPPGYRPAASFVPIPR